MRFFPVAALAITAAASPGHAAVWVAPLMADLEAAAQRWSENHPARYSYTLYVYSGPFGFNSVRLKVKDGQCTAKKRFEFGRHKSWWKKCPCDGYLMEDVYSDLRKALEAKPSDFSANYDSTYGFVKDATVDPDAKVQDVDWSYGVEDFRSLK